LIQRGSLLSAGCACPADAGGFKCMLSLPQHFVPAATVLGCACRGDVLW
jgi:hypothetical protein